jgi:integrase
MPRKATGQVIPTGPRRASWGIRVRAYGRRHFVALGPPEYGWNREKAERELRHVLADVERGIWHAPEPAPSAAIDDHLTFHEFADEWYEGLPHEGLSAGTLESYCWQLESHLLPFLAAYRLDEVTIAEVDRSARRRSAKAGCRPLDQHDDHATRADPRPRRGTRPDRPQPARGRRRRLKQRRPQRTWLDRAELIASLLDAAGELDAEARVDRRATPRRALLATLAFGGLRISEALALRWRDVDLAAEVSVSVDRRRTPAFARSTSFRCSVTSC